MQKLVRLIEKKKKWCAILNEDHEKAVLKVSEIENELTELRSEITTLENVLESLPDGNPSARSRRSSKKKKDGGDKKLDTENYSSDKNDSTRSGTLTSF